MQSYDHPISDLAAPTRRDMYEYTCWVNHALAALRKAADENGELISHSLKQFVADKLGITRSEASELNRWLGELHLLTSPHGNARFKEPHQIDLHVRVVTESMLTEAITAFEIRKQKRKPRPKVSILKPALSIEPTPVGADELHQFVDDIATAMHKLIDGLTANVQQRRNQA